MRYALSSLFAVLAFSSSAIADDHHPDLDLSEPDIEETVYLDPYRAPQLGSAVSEFVWALYRMNYVCLENQSLARFCSELEHALYDGYNDDVEHPRYDPNYLDDLPAQLSPVTADLAANSVLKMLNVFNQHGAMFRVECAMDAECINLPYSDGHYLRVVIPHPPA